MILPDHQGSSPGRPSSGEQSERSGGPSRLRVPGIDGLRAVAILVVMVSHAGLGWIVPGGFGVTIFFFLSGYLITTLLRLEFAAHGAIDLKAFYMRRALRILPPLYLTLLLTVALMAIGAIPIPIDGRGLLLDSLFLTNYAHLFGVTSTTPIPLWSLDVEEHYYMLFPACFALIARMRGRRQALILLSVCAIALLARFATFPTSYKWAIYYWSHTRMDSIMWGAILALWQNPLVDRDAWKPGRIHVAVAVGLILVTLGVRSEFFRETLRYTVQGVALFVLFSAAIQAQGTVRRVLDGRVLKVVALLSYTLYLVHFPLLVMVRPLDPIVGVPIAYGLTFAWSGLLYVSVEKPIARWRRRSLKAALARSDDTTRPGPVPLT